MVAIPSQRKTCTNNNAFSGKKGRRAKRGGQRYYSPRDRHSSFTDLPIKAGKLLRGYHATCAWAHTHTDRQDEFDGFPGRRERPKQCLQTVIVTSIPTDLTIRTNHRRRLASSDHISKPATEVEFMQRISNLGNRAMAHGACRPAAQSRPGRRRRGRSMA